MVNSRHVSASVVHDERVRRFAIRKVLIYVHWVELTTGWEDALGEYLRAKDVADLAILKFPFLRSHDARIRVHAWKSGEFRESRSWVAFQRPEALSFLKDFAYGLAWGMRYGRGADLFVGLNNLLVLVGLLLRSLGWVKRVAYTMVDYTPRRYASPLLNGLYYHLDRWACHHADVVWPLHRRMIEGRVRDGRVDPRRVRWEEAPFGNRADACEQSARAARERTRIVYLGGILKSKGAELFLPILEALRQRGPDNVILECVGGGDVNWLRGEVGARGLQQFVTVHGPVADEAEVLKILCRCGIGIAPYFPYDSNSFSYYADAAKVKMYLGCGLPIVLTGVPPIASEIEAEGCGLVARYDAEDFADKLIAVMQNYEQYQQNAARWGKEFAWTTLFDSLFKRTFCSLPNRESGG